MAGQSSQEGLTARSSTPAGGGAAVKPIPTNPGYYPRPVSARNELRRAQPVFRAFRDASAQLLNEVRLGQGVDLEPGRGPVRDLTESIIRHPDPMIWMMRVDEPETYTIGRSQRTAVLAAVLGRALGMPEPQLVRLAWSGVLCQVGKVRFPRQALERPGPIDEEELERLRGFVTQGVELLKASPKMDPAIIEAVQSHHERFDGSGYPRGLAGQAIPLLGRIVGLADWFDAMTSRKPYSDHVISSTEAIDHLNDSANRLFESQLVEEFVRAIGLYPTGSLVELSTGQVAVVAAQNLDHRTQPEVVLVLNRAKEPCELLRVNLLEYNQAHQDDPTTVKRALSQGEFGLDAREIMASLGEPRGGGWRRFVPGLS